MPAENGLPQYVSRRGRNGPYQYYRRPPTGVVGAAFVRSFRTKDRKVMLAKYAEIHAEAEVYFERLISGRRLSDEELIDILASNLCRCTGYENIIKAVRAAAASVKAQA